MSFEIVGAIVGGLAIFIFGINQLSDGLKSIAGSRIREYIEKYTGSLMSAIIVGTVISAVLHSSTAVTVISISLVRAGMMKLEQAIGITIGANIGTCFTSIMIGLNIEELAYYIVVVGVAMMLLSKKKTQINIGKSILGFGLIFVGLETLGNQLVFISSETWFNDAMLFLGGNPWLSLLGGTIATIILNSSTAVVGIVQKLYTTGAIAPMAGAAFIFGSNVGTTLTAILAGTGGSVSTRRAAWFHVVYNIAGALIGMLLLTPFVHLTNVVNEFLNGSPEMWIAQAHFLFNIISTVLIIPFVNQSVILLKKLIPGEDRKASNIQNIDELDYSLIESFPAAALTIAKENTVRMGYNALENIKTSRQYLISKDQEDFDECDSIEAVVNKYDTTLSKYLLKIAQQETLTSSQTRTYSKNFLIIKNFERMSDISMNIVNSFKSIYEEKQSFSPEAIEDIEKAYTLVEEMTVLSIEYYHNQNNDKEDATIFKIKQMSDELRDFVTNASSRHFKRMKENKCGSERARTLFMDIMALLERIGDVSIQITENATSINQTHDLTAPLVEQI